MVEGNEIAFITVGPEQSLGVGAESEDGWDEFRGPFDDLPYQSPVACMKAVEDADRRGQGPVGEI